MLGTEKKNIQFKMLYFLPTSLTLLRFFRDVFFQIRNLQHPPLPVKTCLQSKNVCNPENFNKVFGNSTHEH